ncbi:unnamed protein product [Paramecium octaurelia]|uniref:Zinc finger PHD-type domain-containing protein n=1 Tax=Paramecium octaurelia TaxID=43137 RepID=A0A8S1UAH8_PAROT|nr:unnamed protein product [Paramecium octaurelia]
MKKKETKFKKTQVNKRTFPNFLKMIDERNFDLFISSYSDIHPENIFHCGFIYTHKQNEKLSINEDAAFLLDNKIWFARIEEIVKIVINGEDAGFIKGRIYLQKPDLIGLHEKIKECTEDDLFLTEQTKWFFCKELRKKIMVYNLNDIIQNNIDTKPGSFYTRSEFNVESQKFLTPVEEWATECICQKLFDNSLGYLQCDRCQRWIHYDCSGLPKEILENLDDHNFNCLICIGEMKVEKIKIKQNEQQKVVEQSKYVDNRQNQIIDEKIKIEKQDRKPLKSKQVLTQSMNHNKLFINEKNSKKPIQKIKSK